eukprot:Amastigsp_a683771_12.p3 type:complete len:258 gc:universal Amastigsp_a683771_12:166-939(+)
MRVIAAGLTTSDDCFLATVSGAQLATLADDVVELCGALWYRQPTSEPGAAVGENVWPTSANLTQRLVVAQGNLHALSAGDHVPPFCGHTTLHCGRVLETTVAQSPGRAELGTKSDCLSLYGTENCDGAPPETDDRTVSGVPLASEVVGGTDDPAIPAVERYLSGLYVRSLESVSASTSAEVSAVSATEPALDAVFVNEAVANWALCVAVQAVTAALYFLMAAPRESVAADASTMMPISSSRGPMIARQQRQRRSLPE